MSVTCSVFNPAPGRRRTVFVGAFASPIVRRRKAPRSRPRGDRGQATDSSGFERVLLTAGRSTCSARRSTSRASR